MVDRNDWKALLSDGDNSDMGACVELSDEKSVGSVCAQTCLKETCCEMEMRGMVRKQVAVLACELKLALWLYPQIHIRP